LKTIRISDAAHRELTRLLGEMMAETGKPQTYNDVIDTLTAQSVIVPQELLEEIDAAISASKQAGFKTRKQFIEEAVTVQLQRLLENQEKVDSAKVSKPKDDGR
jgi:hypothetical protein